MPSLDPSDPASWPILLDMIRSDQMSARQVSDLLIDNAAFADWYAMTVAK